MASVQEEFSGRHQFYQSRCQTIFEMYLSFTFDKLEKICTKIKIKQTASNL